MFKSVIFAVLLSVPFTLSIHILGIRTGFLTKSRPQRGAILSVLISVALLFIVTSGIYSHSISSVSFSLFLITVLFLVNHLYFQVFNLSETARRIRILVEIKTGIGLQTNENLSSEQKIEKRVERLIELGQIVKTENRYRPVKSWLLLIALMFRKFERTLYPERFERV